MHVCDLIRERGYEWLGEGTTGQVAKRDVCEGEEKVVGY